MTILTLFMMILSYVILPAAGITAYIRLIRKMKNERVKRIPKLSFFALFYIYGGWLELLLTAVSGEWSGMASMGIVFMIFIAPLICSMIAFRHRNHIQLSRYHRILFRMSVGYLIGESILLTSVVIYNLIQ